MTVAGLNIVCAVKPRYGLQQVNKQKKGRGCFRIRTEREREREREREKEG